MKLKSLFVIIIATLSFFLLTPAVNAADCQLTTDPSSPLYSPNSLTFRFDGPTVQQELTKIKNDGKLKFSLPGTGVGSCGRPDVPDPSNPVFGPVIKGDKSYGLLCDYDLLGEGQHRIGIIYEHSDGTISEICNAKTYSITSTPPTCKLDVNFTSGIGDVNSDWQVTISNIQNSTGYYCLDFQIDGVSAAPNSMQNCIHLETLQGSYTQKVPSKFITPGKHSLMAYLSGQKPTKTCDSVFFNPSPQNTPAPPTEIPSPTEIPPAICQSSQCNNACSGDCSVCPRCPGIETASQKNITLLPLNPICDVIQDSSKSKCVACVDKHWAWTAIGCIPTNLSSILKDYVLSYGIGIAGGIAFLYFLFGAFLILTSMGNPERIKEGQEIIISSLSGLILIIFSVFILGIIGVDLLKIPGFGR